MEILKKIKNSIKNSLKSVLLNYKEFVGIYVAIMIVQILIGVWSISAFTNHYANDTMFDSNYEHDIIVTGDKSTINRIDSILRHDIQQKNKATFTAWSSGDRMLGVTVKDGKYEQFYDKYLDKYVMDMKIDYTLTPKYIYHTEIQKNIALSSVIIGIVSFVIGILILSVMYSVRTNHYKFQYGIYMTFGADKKMLGSIALNELMAINLLTLVPSAVISYVLVSTVYSANGVSPVINFLLILLYIALSFLAVFIAACLSVGSLFGKPPVALITTADNSNFVSSPRRSFKIFAKKMPLNYEIYSTWRFRKYIARLVFGAVAFSVIFVTGIYCANMLKTQNDASNKEFVLTYRHSPNIEEYRLKANSEAEELLELVADIDKVDKVLFEQSEGFKVRNDHMLLRPGTQALGADYSIHYAEKDGYTRATNNCRYVCIDAVALKQYEEQYNVEYLQGYDAEMLLAAENMIIISEGLYGARSFEFAPGDTVMVGDCEDGVDFSNMPVFSNSDDILKYKINNGKFVYTEYTVGAVIHDTDVTDTVIVGVNSGEYERITHDKQAIIELNVYLDSDVELENITDIREKIKLIMEDYKSWNTDSTNEAVFAIVDRKINLPGLLYVLAILVLMISPVVWIFSQVMFYKKREPEYKLLHAMGATVKEIGGLHAVSGALVFVISFIANFGLSTLFCLGIFNIFTRVLPQLGIVGIRVSFNSFVPVSTMLLYAIVSAICGCISSLIPFLLYKRKLKLEEKAIEAMSANMSKS